MAWMTRSLLLGVAVLFLASCAPRPQPLTYPSYVPPAPEVVRVHALEMVTPPGSGRIALTRTTIFSINGASTTYAAEGAILATESLGEWRFAYTDTSLRDTQSYPSTWIWGVKGLGLSFRNTSAALVEIDWSRSVFVDATSRARPVIHRGVRFNDRTAALAPSVIPAGAILEDFVFPSDQITFQSLGSESAWISPAVFERLEEGSTISITLSMKAGEKAQTRTFAFRVKAEPQAPPTIVSPAPSPPLPPISPGAPEWCRGKNQEWRGGACHTRAEPSSPPASRQFAPP